MVKAIIEQEHYLTRVSADANSIIADEPKSKGGGEKGFAPKQLLAASLASCTAITLRMYCERKQWTMGAIEVTVDLETDEDGVGTVFERKIKFNGSLTEEQHSRLLQIADLCPVHKILATGNIINTSV